MIPLETERILINEKLLPGITKVLRIAQAFPQIDWDPTNQMLWPNIGDGSPNSENELKRLTELCSAVFVYENGPLAGSNGVLNLLSELPSQQGPQDLDLHNLRLEFLKRVFWGYLQDMMVFEMKDVKAGMIPPD